MLNVSIITLVLLSVLLSTSDALAASRVIGRVNVRDNNIFLNGKVGMMSQRHHLYKQHSINHRQLQSTLLGIDSNDSEGESLALSGPGVKAALQSFFQTVDEGRLQEVDDLLDTYRGREKVLLAGLEKMYSQPVIQYDIMKLDGATIAAETTKQAFPQQQFDWSDAWYPVAFPKFLDKAIPTSVSILNKPYVLYFDHVKSIWSLADDLCPHRLAPLSEGRVDDHGCIECPYHGWSFDSQSGQCTKIPQLPSTNKISQLSNPAYSIKTYPIIERQGLLFMYPRPIAEVGLLPREEAIPLCAPLEDPDVVCLDVSRDLPYDFSTLLENILDPSHVPFTHHGTIGNRNWANEVPLLIKGAATLDGFSGTYQFVPLSGPMTRPTTTAAGGVNSSSSSSIERYSQFKAPVYSITSISRSDLQSWTVVYAVPSAPGQTRIIGRFPFKFKTVDEGKKKMMKGFNMQKFIFKIVPNWLQHIQQNTVLDDDNIFLKLQEERAQAMGADWRKYLLPTRADLFVCQYRLWLEKFGHPFTEFYNQYKLSSRTTTGAITSTSNINNNDSSSVNNSNNYSKNKLMQVNSIKHSPFDPMSARLGLLDRYSQHVLQCKPCADALRNFKLIKRYSVLVLVLAVSPIGHLLSGLLTLLGLGKIAQAQALRSKLPWKTMAGLLSIASIAAWVISDGFESKLTKGAWPAPRNKLTIRPKTQQRKIN